MPSVRRFLTSRTGAGHADYQYQKTNPIQNGKELTEATGKFLKKHYNLNEPVFMKDPEGHNLNNLWTGYGYGGKGRAIATVGLLGTGSIIAGDMRGFQGFVNSDRSMQQSEELDIESLQSTRADGQGYQAQIGTGASNMLTTSGDLVFAMHKTRHSGQF